MKFILMQVNSENEEEIIESISKIDSCEIAEMIEVEDEILELDGPPTIYYP